MKLEKPSKSLLKTVLIAAFISAITTAAFLFIVALPMIYGIDPTGLGKVVGINSLLPLAKQVATAQVQSQNDIKSGETNNLPPMLPAGVAESPPEERKDTVSLVIPPKQGFNYRLFMERDYALDYSWTTDGKPIYTELFGERMVANKTEVKSFGKITDNKAKGFFMVPFAGKFGWHWENKSDRPITVRLTTKGVYKILG